MPPLRRGDEARVRLDPTCRGTDRPHHPSKDCATGGATSVQDHVGHAYFVAFHGRPVYRMALGQPMSVLGLPYRADELEHVVSSAESTTDARGVVAARPRGAAGGIPEGR